MCVCVRVRARACVAKVEDGYDSQRRHQSRRPYLGRAAPLLPPRPPFESTRRMVPPGPVVGEVGGFTHKLACQPDLDPGHSHGPCAAIGFSINRRGGDGCNPSTNRLVRTSTNRIQFAGSPDRSAHLLVRFRPPRVVVALRYAATGAGPTGARKTAQPSKPKRRRRRAANVKMGRRASRLPRSTNERRPAYFGFAW